MVFEWGPNLYIEPTDVCNLHCPACRRSQGTTFMQLDTFKKILGKIQSTKVNQIAFFWRGEPTLSPFLPAMVEYAKRRGCRTFTSTNMATPNLHDLQYVSKLLSSLDRLEVCVDGYDQTTIQKYRVGTNWETLVKNLETISRVPTKCNKEMRVLMFKHNSGYKPYFRGLAKKYNMTKITFGLPIIEGKMRLTTKEADEWLSSEEKYQRYEKQGEFWVHKTKKTCVMLPVITVNGDVSICCYDRYLEHPIGNLLTDRMEQIIDNLDRIKPQMMRRQLNICNEYCFLPRKGLTINFREMMH